MAQKTGKEEADFKVATETIVLCGTCGVSANSVVNNLCQKCCSAATPMSHVFAEEKSRSSSSARFYPDRSPNPPETTGDLEKKDVALITLSRKTAVNRCSGCSRKVGLNGFRCRCGELFCVVHRYSDRHDCSYDYKAAGREAIARENPVVKAAKIVRF